LTGDDILFTSKSFNLPEGPALHIRLLNHLELTTQEGIRLTIQKSRFFPSPGAELVPLEIQNMLLSEYIDFGMTLLPAMGGYPWVRDSSCESNEIIFTWIIHHNFVFDDEYHLLRLN
jgi:hypothetical protein